MPYLRIQTNLSISDETRSALVSKASQLIAEGLAKPERYVMVAMEPNTAMLFAGSGDPLAYLELKSIGLPENKTVPLSQSLCRLMQKSLSIAPDRVYIEFSNAPRQMWGWNEGTF